jgi:ATP-dependent helicase/nuclease subunit A
LSNLSSQPRELKPEQKIAAHTLDRHLSVTAGPGAGKTFVLVERYLEILRSKKASVENIVAITFTNRAANEMRQRVRDRIDGLLRTLSDKERQAWLRHKRTLDGAVITTIHGFCSRLLHEFPVEANIDPQFVLLDEHQSIMMLEGVVDEALAEAIHSGDETILQFTQGTGRAALAGALGDLHRKYRDQGLSLDRIEQLTFRAHASEIDYFKALKELDAQVAQLLSASRLSPAAEEKRARFALEWPALRKTLAQPPTEETIGNYTQGIEDLWDARPQKGRHPSIERIDALLWGENANANDRLRGQLPAIGFDLLAKKYALALVRLLRNIASRLDAEKQKLSVLDFDDLQLRTLKLLDQPTVLTRVSERYRYFLVDEFQDTNGLQRDLLRKLALARGANLFIVGDRKQSIYGFRGADVDVFSEMTSAIEAAGGLAQPLLLNFRSQKPLIDALNFLFAQVFESNADVPFEAVGELGYVEHEPSTAVRGIENDPPHVELIISAIGEDEDSSGAQRYRRSNLSAHERDAEQVAARISELITPGYAGVPPAEKESTPEAYAPRCAPRDIAILLRAFTGVWTYESALRRAGVPYLTVQGKGFYQREEITDLIQLLRFLDNTTDELALAAILRSPLGGISDNTLFALRCAPWIDEPGEPTRLHRRNLLRALRRHREIQFIETEEHLALDRIAAWIEAMTERRNRYGIADLLRYAVSSSEFLTIMAANFDGAQRVTNIEKLFRLAEQFERSGHLIRDFVHYVEEFEAIGGREGEGQMDESANVVRLMTIHQAKGLEFPIVIIPDLHREANRREFAFILDRHRGMTVRVPDGRGRSVRGALFNQLSQRNKWREDFESMRLLYVAATRAKDRLIFSAAVERKRLETLDKSELWVGWLWRALGLEQQSQTGLVDLPDDAQIHITINREGTVESSPTIAPKNESETTVDLSRPFPEIFPLLQPITAQTGTILRRFTVTQLINFQRCARQYYFERMLRTPNAEERAVWNDAEAPEPPANLTATLKGAVIHRFCETYVAGDDLENRLRTSFEEVKASRQSELAGRVFDINDEEAVRALMPLAQHYLTSDVYRRVQSCANSKFQIPNSKSENQATHAPFAIPDPPFAIPDPHFAIPDPQFAIPDPQVAIPDRRFAIRNPQSAPGLWSELRFRLRRPLGILTGTIDKLLITPALDGDGVDVEIIDFKTNRFSSPPANKTVGIATAKATAVNASGQSSFDFETVVDESSAETSTGFATSLDDQAQRIARDYQLQMQAYALALRELLPAAVAVKTLRATLHFLDPNLEISLPAELLDSIASAQAVDGAMQTIAELDGTLDANWFPPLPATHCRTCNFLELCPAGRDFLRGSAASI